MQKFILVFNPKDNIRNDDRLDMDCYHIYECLKGSSTDYGTGAKAIRKALQGFKRTSLLNANWFLCFNFSRVIDPERKRP